MGTCDIDKERTPIRYQTYLGPQNDLRYYIQNNPKYIESDSGNKNSSEEVKDSDKNVNSGSGGGYSSGGGYFSSGGVSSSYKKTYRSSYSGGGGGRHISFNDYGDDDGSI